MFFYITYNINSTEHMAVVVAGLQVLGDIGKCTEIFWVLGSAGNVPDFMLSNNILPNINKQHFLLGISQQFTKA